MKSLKLALAAGLLAAAGPAAPALAHHSHAMFDDTKAVTLVGTVKAFEWTNPHIWIQLAVPNPAGGGETEWSLEGGAPSQLMRRGWRRTSLAPGETVTIVAAPLRTGGPGGEVNRVTKADGSVIGARGE